MALRVNAPMTHRRWRHPASLDRSDILAGES